MAKLNPHLKSSFKELQIELRKAKSEVEKAEPYNPKKQEDTTRSKLALIFVIGYFIILGAGIFLVLVNNFLVEYFHFATDSIISVKDIISVISGTIGTSLGFVVGYYFKSSESHNKV